MLWVLVVVTAVRVVITATKLEPKFLRRGQSRMHCPISQTMVLSAALEAVCLGRFWRWHGLWGFFGCRVTQIPTAADPSILSHTICTTPFSMTMGSSPPERLHSKRSGSLHILHSSPLHCIVSEFLNGGEQMSYSHAGQHHCRNSRRNCIVSDTSVMDAVHVCVHLPMNSSFYITLYALLRIG